MSGVSCVLCISCLEIFTQSRSVQKEDSQNVYSQIFIGNGLVAMNF